MGQLYLVPTPVGNLDDMTLRGIETLRSVDFILVEDTRKTGRLLKHFGIENKMYSYHQHNEHKKTPGIIKKIQGGQDAALVSSAGTPGISDPGYLIIRACIDQNVPFTCLPGATAFVPALVGSGLPADRFCFEGFLPRKKGRKKRLRILAEEIRTIIFYVPPHRLLKSLKEYMQFFGTGRPAAVGKEISKMHETFVHGSLKEIHDYFDDRSVKGEYVIIVSGKK